MYCSVSYGFRDSCDSSDVSERETYCVFSIIYMKIGLATF